MAYKPSADSYVDATIVLADLASSLIDQAAGTASLRTLGTGATQALAGNTAVELTTNKNAASGYAGLDGSTLLTTAVHGTGTANSTTFLRGDRTWAASTATKPITIKRINSGANNITIDPNSTETVDGATTRILTQQYESVTLVSNGSNWFVV
jgi:hypothetical protein